MHSMQLKLGHKTVTSNVFLGYEWTGTKNVFFGIIIFWKSLVARLTKIIFVFFSQQGTKKSPPPGLYIKRTGFYMHLMGNSINIKQAEQSTNMIFWINKSVILSISGIICLFGEEAVQFYDNFQNKLGLPLLTGNSCKIICLEWERVKLK